ncbi:transglycosylase domain-containing protein [Ponticoccus sp. SC2-23]|uniref:transglycosylase domain-containing protein n=1 Tax=Alexandriicola marinus TaxID=2081710 RepID=UPI000FD9EA4C|nr:transglycosylase domain-containing protein [Alexandriicola marinus]MBM1219007.1 transglycosylase domain-containing protein [Ponticoccus sp. SC6-9]MBM1223921.1 transglycosylase domain-containing protein [Ponticoccus sp. SC6-15]MBM1230300.1 transglycosylase domain-containing protein [Ponticoccus sp. SC6-38]MBM1232887.1 transglycosylase domain-containing protein [Ponticoccus sp. SC6-45]MBM1237163.1 transglycosylase domain-containing protein [Ponticoccus sp. SC6-49]MBM1241898.1 transglycosylas
MKRFFRRLLILAVLVLALALGYGWLGFRDAHADAETLRARADALIEADRGGVGLGVNRRQMLIDVEDPAFLAHVGVDFTTPGAGSATITQSVASWLGLEGRQHAISWLRKTGFALALEQELTKPQILALYLDIVPMGPGPDGDGINGFWPASQAYFGGDPGDIGERDFLALLAVMIAPTDLQLANPGPPLEERINRIERLLSGTCEPLGHDDVWFEGCAAT